MILRLMILQKLLNRRRRDSINELNPKIILNLHIFDLRVNGEVVVASIRKLFASTLIRIQLYLCVNGEVVVASIRKLFASTFIRNKL
jgi:hypothetical protein